MWDEMATIVELTTGMKLGKAGMEEAADYIFQSVRKFNLQEGMTLDEESLPKRFAKELWKTEGCSPQKIWKPHVRNILNLEGLDRTVS